MMVILLFLHFYFSIIIPDLEFFNFSFNYKAISVDWIAVALQNKTTQHLDQNHVTDDREKLRNSRV